MSDLQKILIANRGEIALRVIRTCHEMGLNTVAVYSTIDRDALHVRFADEAVCIGPAASGESYLRPDRLIAAAEVTGADAIHPGYGFLAENAEFSQICADNDIEFIGPSAETISLMGEKSKAKERMHAAGVPIVEGSDGTVANFDRAYERAADIGFPVMVKAAAGGGGTGMRLVRSPDAFENAFNGARSTSRSRYWVTGRAMSCTLGSGSARSSVATKSWWRSAPRRSSTRRSGKRWARPQFGARRQSTTRALGRSSFW